LFFGRRQRTWRAKSALAINSEVGVYGGQCVRPKNQGPESLRHVRSKYEHGRCNSSGRLPRSCGDGILVASVVYFNGLGHSKKCLRDSGTYHVAQDGMSWRPLGVPMRALHTVPAMSSSFTSPRLLCFISISEVTGPMASSRRITDYAKCGSRGGTIRHSRLYF